MASKEQTGKVRRRNKIIGEYFDYNILIIVALLIIFGLIMIYSTSSYNALNDKGNANYYLMRQGLATLIGIGVMLITMFIPMKVIMMFSEFIYYTSLATVFLVLTGLGAAEGGANQQ